MSKLGIDWGILLISVCIIRKNSTIKQHLNTILTKM